MYFTGFLITPFVTVRMALVSYRWLSVDSPDWQSKYSTSLSCKPLSGTHAHRIRVPFGLFNCLALIRNMLLLSVSFCEQSSPLLSQHLLLFLCPEFRFLSPANCCTGCVIIIAATKSLLQCCSYNFDLSVFAHCSTYFGWHVSRRTMDQEQNFVEPPSLFVPNYN